jgi:hypothetical protein
MLGNCSRPNKLITNSDPNNKLPTGNILVKDNFIQIFNLVIQRVDVEAERYPATRLLRDQQQQQLLRSTRTLGRF